MGVEERGADLSKANLGILWHLKMHRGCFGMDCFMVHRVFAEYFNRLFVRGPEQGKEDLSTKSQILHCQRIK